MNVNMNVFLKGTYLARRTFPHTHEATTTHLTLPASVDHNTTQLVPGLANFDLVTSPPNRLPNYQGINYSHQHHSSASDLHN